MPQTNNVIQFKKRKKINIGIVIFLIIGVYMAVYLYIFLTKPQISIYEVRSESLAKESTVTGIALREEKVYQSGSAGYVNYYQREGARVAKNTTIYSIDESKAVYEKLNDQGDEVKLSESDIKAIKRDIKSFQKNYSNFNYLKVYEFKDEVSTKIQELIDINLQDNMETIVKNTGLHTSFEVMKSDASGVVSYKVDGLEGLTEESISSQTFLQDRDQKDYIIRKDLVEANSTVYKLVTSDHWSILAPLQLELYEELKDRTFITFVINNDGLELTAPLQILQKGDTYFIKINMNRYMIRYLGERYLELDFMISSDSGYKIPLSAITEKQFFMVPTSYLTYGGDSEEEGIVVQTYDTTGNISYNFKAVTIYYEDDMYSYIDLDTVPHGSMIYHADSNETFPVSMVGKLEGVFNINKGYAVFRRIERITQNEEYCIVKKDTMKGLALYDHIALVAELVEESALIY